MSAVIIYGSNTLKTINYLEKRGSAQCKSSMMLAALKASGVSKIKAKKSRDHTERMFKNLKIPINLKSKKNYDIIKIKNIKQYDAFDYIYLVILVQQLFIVLTPFGQFRIVNQKCKYKPVENRNNFYF